jgi:hypothetical protein
MNGKCEKLNIVIKPVSKHSSQVIREQSNSSIVNELIGVRMWPAKWT